MDKVKAKRGFSLFDDSGTQVVGEAEKGQVFEVVEQVVRKGSKYLVVRLEDGSTAQAFAAHCEKA